MSQDLWIATVRIEVETSPAFLQAHEIVSAWANRRGVIDFFATTPPEVVEARDLLEAMVDQQRIAFEAGRRYQGALREWRYRQG